MAIKNSSDTIGNRTHAMPQPTGPPRLVSRNEWEILQNVLLQRNLERIRLCYRAEGYTLFAVFIGPDTCC